MTLKLRRVVTGHHSNGKARVLIDEQITNAFSPRPGATFGVIWSNDTLPANNQGDEDPSNKKIGTSIKGGAVFRVVQFDPGVTPRNHRTDSVDYAVVMAGEIDMVLDDETVTLRAGDLLVQRGTIHNWINKGTEPCIIAFTLIDADPVTVDGQPLNARG